VRPFRTSSSAKASSRSTTPFGVRVIFLPSTAASRRSPTAKPACRRSEAGRVTWYFSLTLTSGTSRLLLIVRLLESWKPTRKSRRLQREVKRLGWVTRNHGAEEKVLGRGRRFGRPEPGREFYPANMQQNQPKHEGRPWNTLKRGSPEAPTR